ncbi:MAG: exo-alpha-sialidase [Thermodesulfovibrionales bacterium]
MIKRLTLVSITIILYLIAFINFKSSPFLKGMKKEILPELLEHCSSNKELFKEDFINNESPDAISHVSSIAPLDKDRLIAVWYAGSREGAKDVAIFMAIYNEKTGLWTEPLKLIDRKIASEELRRYVKKVGNPMLMRDSSGRIWLFYSSVIAGGWSGSSINYKTTTDGIFWTESKKLLLSPFLNLTHNVKNDGINLNDGTFVIPAYSELFNKTSSIIWIDEGNVKIEKISEGTGIIQPVLLPDGRHRILMFFRNTQKKERRFIPSIELDLINKTFTPVKYTELPNPDSGFDMIRTEDGSILAVINNSFQNRENLSLFISQDNGASWRLIKVLEHHQGKEYSYPSITKSLKGFYHITYTYERKRIKHVMFNEIWLEKQKTENRNQKIENIRQMAVVRKQTRGPQKIVRFFGAQETRGPKKIVRFLGAQEIEGRQQKDGILSLSFMPGIQFLILWTGCFLIILVLIKYLIKISGLKGRTPFIITLVSSIILSFLPLGKLSLTDLILSINPWFSVGSIVFLLYFLFPKIKCYSATVALSHSRTVALSLWTFLISMFLFLSIYDFVALDIYSYGYNFSVFAPVLFLLNMILAISGNPLSLVFNLYILSFISGLIPSQNIFDAITDGLAFILSTGFLLSGILKRGISGLYKRLSL